MRSSKGSIDGFLAIFSIALFLTAGLFYLGDSITGLVPQESIVTPDAVSFSFFADTNTPLVGDTVIFDVLPIGAKTSITIKDSNGNIRAVRGLQATFDRPGPYEASALVSVEGRQERFTVTLDVLQPPREFDAKSDPLTSPTGLAIPSEPLLENKEAEYVYDMEWTDLEGDKGGDVFEEIVDGTIETTQQDETGSVPHTRPAAIIQSSGEVFEFYSDKTAVDLGEEVTFYVSPIDADLSVTITTQAGQTSVLDGMQATFDAAGIYTVSAVIYDGVTTERISIVITAGNMADGAVEKIAITPDPVIDSVPEQTSNY